MPVVALLDNDVMGREAAKKLVDLFGFSKKQEIMSYAEVLHSRPVDVEAEDLWPNKLLQRFIDEQGEEAVLAEKVHRKDLNGWHYGFNATGKDLIGPFLHRNATPTDATKWVDLLVLMRKRLGLGIN